MCVNIVYNICLSQDFGNEQNQIKFGSVDVVEMGINISYNSSHQVTDELKGYSSRNGFEFSPYIGFFVAKDFEIGTRFFDYKISHTSNDFSNTSHRNINILVAPTYYLFSDLFIEPQIGLSFLNERISVAVLSVEEKYTGVVFGGRAGIKTEIVPHVLLNISYQYQSIAVSRANDSRDRKEISTLFSVGLTTWFFSN